MGAAVTRQNGGYLDSGRGRFDASPSILARVFRRRRAVLCESCGIKVIDGRDACYELARVSCPACFLERLEA